MGNPVQVQVLLSARKLREMHRGVWAADASLLAGRRITIRVYTAIAVGQAFRRNACMHFDSKAENILFYECFSAFFFLKNCKNSVCSNQNSNKRAGIRAFDLWALSLIFAFAFNDKL